jgi:hypothetical protein
MSIALDEFHVCLKYELTLFACAVIQSIWDKSGVWTHFSRHLLDWRVVNNFHSPNQKTLDWGGKIREMGKKT